MKKTIRVAAVAAVVLAGLGFSAAWGAGDEAGDTQSSTYQIPPDQYFAVLPGYFFADGGRDATRTGSTISGIYGHQFGRKWVGEINLFTTNINTGPHVNSDFYQTGFELDGGYNLIGDRTAFTVFVIGGVGAVYDDVIPNRYDSINALGSAGLGFVTPRLFGINLKIRGEARALADTYRSATQRGMIDARASLGLEFPFGGETVQVVRVPQPVQVAAAPPPPPSHHTCPYVLPGTKVDQFNCPVAGQTIVLHGVHFAFNSDRLTLNAKTVLNNAVRMMNGAPKMTVEVAGHTDGIGSAAYNLKLSQKRANAVRSFLISKGISADRLTAKGYGKSEPLVSPERTNKDRAINRRVEFRVLTGG